MKSLSNPMYSDCNKVASPEEYENRLDSAYAHAVQSGLIESRDFFAETRVHYQDMKNLNPSIEMDEMERNLSIDAVHAYRSHRDSTLTDEIVASFDSSLAADRQAKWDAWQAGEGASPEDYEEDLNIPPTSSTRRPKP